MEQEFNSKHLVAKEYQDKVEKLHVDGKSFAEAIPVLMEVLLIKSEPQHEKVITIAGEGETPAIDLYVYRPDNKGDGPMPLIYYCHGGGYLAGKADMYADNFKLMANTHGATLISVEYRLATKAPYPADLQDAYRGLCYCYDHAEELGIDVNHIVVMGESAGGGLTARMALYNRDHRQIPLSGQVLIYPMLDCRTGTEKDKYKNIYAGEMLWTRAMNCMGWTTLLGGQQLDSSEEPYYSAALAADLCGLPPTLIIVGSLDLFVDEDIDYAHRLIAASVDTQLLVIPGVFHAFDMFESPQTQLFKTVRDEAIARMMA